MLKTKVMYPRVKPAGDGFWLARAANPIDRKPPQERFIGRVASMIILAVMISSIREGSRVVPSESLMMSTSSLARSGRRTKVASRLWN